LFIYYNSSIRSIIIQCRNDKHIEIINLSKLKKIILKNKKKIAFLLPYYEGRNHSEFLGVGYLSQVLLTKGYDTLIFDEDAICYLMEKKNAENTFDSSRQFIFKKLSDYNPDVICVTINTANYTNSLSLLRFIRKRFVGIKIIVGGPHITSSWATFKMYHKNLFDVAIIGEGEQTLLDVCNRLFKKKSLNVTNGAILSASNTNNLIANQLINKLDDLPFPDREGFYKIFSNKEYPIIEKNYQDVFYSFLPGFRDKKYARIVGSRGCAFACDFCSPSILWKNNHTGIPVRRIRNPKKVVDEIEFLYQKKYRAFYFDDPTFPFKSEPDFYKTMISEFKKRNIHIKWSAPTRSDELSKEILQELYDSGFTYTYFGLETDKKEKLINLGKCFDIEHSLNAIKWCDEIGIHCDVSYQVGVPGDNLDSIIKSIQWLEKHGLQKKSFFSIAAIWPETPLAIRYGLTSDDFEPETDKKKFEARGLYFFEPGNPQIERYYSNCSGNFHFIDEATAIQIKYYLMDAGFIKRFDNKKIISAKD